MRHPERIAKAVFSFVTRLIYGPESIRLEFIRPVLVEMHFLARPVSVERLNTFSN